MYDEKTMIYYLKSNNEFELWQLSKQKSEIIIDDKNIYGIKLIPNINNNNVLEQINTFVHTLKTNL